MNDEKYQVALEAAKKELGIDRKELPVLERVLGNIFPELRESEDERIRKAIIDALNSHGNSINLLSSRGYSMDDAISYLEKQKEQKPELYDMGRWDEESYNNGIHHVLQNPEVYGLTKQKPIHTAKEMWKEMRLEVYAQASGNRHEPNHSDDSTKMFSLCDIDEIFEKIGNSTVGLQPEGWSEEDEKR